MKTSRLLMSVTLKPTLLRIGRGRVCLQSSSGNAPRRRSTSKEISSKAKYFTRAQRRFPRTIFTKCLATSGNGLAAPTHPTPGIALHRARSANTMGSSCAISTFCVVVPAPRRRVTFAAPTAISFSLKSAGNSPAFDWRATRNESRI